MCPSMETSGKGHQLLHFIHATETNDGSFIQTYAFSQHIYQFTPTFLHPQTLAALVGICIHQIYKPRHMFPIGLSQKVVQIEASSRALPLSLCLVPSLCVF